MKKLFYIILFLPLLCQAQSVEDDPVSFAHDLQLKKTIKKCVEIVQDGSADRNKNVHRRYVYNAAGNILTDINYKEENPADSAYILYTYNGLALETKKYNGYTNMESDVIEAATEYYEYNNMQQLNRKTIVTVLNDTTIYTFNYNEKGQPDTIFADSAVYMRYTFFYNDAGKLIRKMGETPIVNSMDWLLIDSFAYEFDNKNRLLKEIHMKENTERKRSLFEYNDKGKLAKKTIYVYGDTKPVYTIEYTYDAKTGLPAARSIKSIPDKNKLEFKVTKYVYNYTYRK
ncbi:MAG: hypothetical protein ACXWDO_09855 [Bacteroidia bacterium]